MSLSAFCLVIIFTSMNLTAQVNQVWVEVFNGGNPNVITLDATGNVYVTGHLNNGDYGTIKYIHQVCSNGPLLL